MYVGYCDLDDQLLRHVSPRPSTYHDTVLPRFSVVLDLNLDLVKLKSDLRCPRRRTRCSPVQPGLCLVHVLRTNLVPRVKIVRVESRSGLRRIDEFEILGVILPLSTFSLWKR